MSTHAFASAVFPVPIEKVWIEIRDFTFPGKLISTIQSCGMEDKADCHTVGATRVMKWKSGESRTDRLLELSDQFRYITWELTHAEPATETAAAITTVRCHRITESNHTLVSWSCDYSAEITKDFVSFNQKAFLENLKEMRTFFFLK